jgi:hypothetical protein
MPTPEELNRSLYDYLADLWADVKAVGKWNLATIYAVIRDAVGRAEEIARTVGGIDGATRKEMVVVAVDALVDIPYVPDVGERIIFKTFLGPVIDVIVAGLNLFFGHNWYEKTIRAEVARAGEAPGPGPDPGPDGGSRQAPLPVSGVQRTHAEELAARIPPGGTLPA